MTYQYSLSARPESRESWLDDAACRGMDIKLFFPDEGEDVDPQAKAVCEKCPVIEDCLRWALKHEAYGYQGGMSAYQRGRERAKRRIALFSPNMYIGPIMR